MMKKIAFLITAVLFSITSYGQTAREVLDKAAAVVSAKEGVTADFTMTSAQYGNTSGTIAVKGRKFHATIPVATMWFDGKTQWTYMKKNNEVNVTNPTEAQLQAINPYNFINLYKKGYKSTMTSSATSHTVHLTADNQKQRIKELFITVNKKTNAPTEVKLLIGTKWTTFTIRNLKKSNLGDAEFAFNSKDYPTAEVIDLR